MPRRTPYHRAQGAEESRRRKEADPFYSSKRWRSFRRWYLSRRPYCADPFHVHGPHQPVLADTVDHIVPRSSGGDDWEVRNLQPLCRRCHSRKTRDEQNNPPPQAGTGSV